MLLAKAFLAGAALALGLTLASPVLAQESGLAQARAQGIVGEQAEHPPPRALHAARHGAERHRERNGRGRGVRNLPEPHRRG
jgi:hypothetical protein